MKKINETKSLSELINSSIFKEKLDNKEFDKVIRKSTVFSFWKDIAGKKFFNLTRPYSIKGSKIFISAKSPIVEQELSFYKKKLLEKINSYSKPLGIEIKEIVFNYKNFNENTEQNKNFDEDKPVWINEEELNEINLKAEEENNIKEVVEKIAFLTESQKESLRKNIINNQKAILYRKNNKN